MYFWVKGQQSAMFKMSRTILDKLLIAKLWDVAP